MSSGPRILEFDVETAQNVVLSHRLFERRGLTIPYESILQEGYIICASWKWLGEKQIYSAQVAPRPIYPFRNDRDEPVVRALHKAVSEADAVIAHNGDGFDVPWLRARGTFYRLAPLPPVIQIDTKKMAARHFRYNTNRLDYLAAYFGIGRKIKTDLDLWIQCIFGDRKAIDEMVRYNKYDVYPLLEGVYKVLRPYVPARISYALYGTPNACPTCGESALHKHSARPKGTTLYDRMRCHGCGAWSKRHPKTGRVTPW